MTVTDLLKKQGYRTGHFGKWHMGDVQKNGTFGLDTIKVSGGNRRDPRGRDAIVTDSTIDFIKANKDKPFYINVWFHTPHNPVRPPVAFSKSFADLVVNKSDFKNPDLLRYFEAYEKLGGNLDEGMRHYLGDLAQLDGQVARILRALDELELKKNTIVAFASDNGPGNGVGGVGEKAKLSENLLGSAGPFRERKHSLYDGGIHQSLIVRWSGLVKAGRVGSKSLLAGVDWLPTLCAITAVKLEAKDFVGEDMSDVWRGKERQRTKDLFWRTSNPNADAIVLRGSWKFRQPRKGLAELYNLEKDPGERDNVADRNVDTVKQLDTALNRWKDTLPKTYIGSVKDN